ncbi:GPR1/FUN34/yaaH family-domain-containing protein [Ilyonectria robusta]|uniref:GPR1/FUN34/yaaH family-domain-containing protein n=1 Tax=Ilyonectria robusta TaxID=1079257 RepID=UPI001E8D6E15|nr:GPR1/FUN34/yaaH family-domain-containing protein [Ilyonectria robusta]KAH8672294.1 GPR1/FUN34/yaaH family-domain-containing protein [Ilyonectria robusta]
MDMAKPIEFQNGHVDPEMGHVNALETVRTAGSIAMTPELFEKLYLSPPNAVKGELRKTFGNPTPLALVGFLLSLMPLSCDLMGWRGAGLFGAATIAVYFFMGGVLMLLSGIMEWVLGNSFPSIVFCSFGCFWLAFGGTLNPSFAAFSSYAPADAKSPAEGMATRGFNASLGFWLVFMGLLAVVYLICALRTNVVFVIIFFTLIPAFALLTGAFWVLAEDYTGNADLANKLFVAAGAILFCTCAAGWYILVAIMFEIVDFPIQLPVGDLSSVIQGRSGRIIHP